MTLKAEIENDPLRRGYAGMDNAELHTNLHTANREVDQDIDIDAFNSYRLKRGKGSNELLDGEEKLHATAMGKKLISRVQELRLGAVKFRDIGYVRRNN